MYGQPSNNQTNAQQPPWLVRAEVTIRRRNPVISESEQSSTGTSPTVSDPGGVHMIYRWSNQPNPTNIDSSPSTSFGFRRGNILFTSTPPSRSTFKVFKSESPTNDDSQSSRGPGGVNLNDSGYNSEQFSPQSYSSQPIRRPSQQYDRRCKSTCNIVLSTISTNEKNTHYERANADPHFLIKENTKYSSDLWHNHPSHVSARCHFSTVPEVCEDCLESGGSSTGFSTHFCTRVPDKTNIKSTSISKDASSQTTDIESRGSWSTSKSNKGKKKVAAGSHHLDEKKKAKENPVPFHFPLDTSSCASSTQDKSDSSKDDCSKKKSRTVHIDVYCTGTDDDESTDKFSSEDEHTTPTTVFENEDIRVTHTPIASSLPRGFTDDKAFLKRAVERRCESFRYAPMRMPSLASSKGYESDDVLSSLYPSQFSSYSALRDLDSVPWSAASSSVAIPLDDNESTIATSSKDTFSDIESLLSVKSNLTPCDSFEYANSSDKERIQKLETFWDKSTKQTNSKTWKSSQIERKHQLQSRKLHEYLKKHNVDLSSGSESTEESDESGAIGWSFVSSDDSSRLFRKDSRTQCSSIDRNKDESLIKSVTDNSSTHFEDNRTDSTTYTDLPSFANFSQTGPFSKSPSPVPLKIPSRVTSPFTTPQGEKTDHIIKASIFGAVINAFRKPGHHIGPSKNPSCSCEHCRRYFEENDQRGRTRSLSEFERRLGPLFRRERSIRSDPPSRKD